MPRFFSLIQQCHSFHSGGRNAERKKESHLAEKGKRKAKAKMDGVLKPHPAIGKPNGSWDD
jgi:hypothetical protein